MISTRRINDPIKSQHRSRKDRVVISDEGYHYRTREEQLIGPFVTEANALYDLNNFIELTSIQQQLMEDQSLIQNWG